MAVDTVFSAGMFLCWVVEYIDIIFIIIGIHLKGSILEVYRIDYLVVQVEHSTSGTCTCLVATFRLLGRRALWVQSNSLSVKTRVT